jgi:hypothetical protein
MPITYKEDDIVFRLWKQHREIKMQRKHMERIRQDLTYMSTKWAPCFDMDEEQQRLFCELQETLKEYLKRLEFVYYIPDGSRVFPLYEEIECQIEQIKKYLTKYMRCENTQDAVLKIGAAIRALINTTVK